MTAHVQQQRMVLSNESLISQADRRILDRLTALAQSIECQRTNELRIVLAPHIAPGLTRYCGLAIQRAMGGNSVAVVPA